MAQDSLWETPAAKTLRAEPGFELDQLDRNSTPGFTGNKADGERLLEERGAVLSDLQELLYANGRSGDSRSVLLVLQGMDTAGKGGIVKHVVGGCNPQGVQYRSFGKPTAEELSHHYLWRIRNALPTGGHIGVFDRSHYEDVLIGRVRHLADDAEIERRYGAINAFEKGLVDRGIRIVKVMLHISSDEQKARLAERLDRPDKYWKYNPADVDERALWPQYMDAYQTVFDRTSTPDAPWFVVPADREWYARLAVQALLLDALEEIDPQWPAADFDVAVEKARLAAS